MTEPDPAVDVNIQDGVVTMVIVNASIVESNGELVPGLALNPAAAIELAHVLIGKALMLLNAEDEN